MKKIVIGVAIVVVILVVLFGAYKCSGTNDASGETAVNGAGSSEAAEAAPAAEQKEEAAAEETKKEDESAKQQEEEIKEKPVKPNLNPAVRKSEKREKAPIPPKEPAPKSASKPEPVPRTDKLPVNKKEPGSNIDSAGVMKVIRASNAAIKRCYDRALISNPSLKGKIAVKIVVNVDGKVGSVDLSEDTLNDADVAKCVKGVIGRLRFPKPEGGPATIVYPYSFSR